MGVPCGAFHGEEADISGNSGGDALHEADDAVALVGFAFEDVEGVLDAGAAEAAEFGAEEVLVLRVGHIIGKHHEHGGRRAGRIFSGW